MEAERMREQRSDLFEIVGDQANEAGAKTQVDTRSVLCCSPSSESVEDSKLLCRFSCMGSAATGGAVSCSLSAAMAVAWAGVLGNRPAAAAGCSLLFGPAAFVVNCWLSSMSAAAVL